MHLTGHRVAASSTGKIDLILLFFITSRMKVMNTNPPQYDITYLRDRPMAEVSLGLSAIFSWRVSSPKYFLGLPHIQQEQTVLFFAR